MIVFLSPVNVRTRQDATRLLADEVLQHYVGLVVTINYEDDPPGSSRGSTHRYPTRRFDERTHGALGYAPISDPSSFPYSTARAEYRTECALTFWGSFSHPVRRELFEALGDDPDGPVDSAPYEWYDHSKDQKRSYVEELLESWSSSAREASAHAHTASWRSWSRPDGRSMHLRC